MTITATHDIADYKVDLIAHFLAVEGEGGYPYYDRATKNSDNEYPFSHQEHRLHLGGHRHRRGPDSQRGCARLQLFPRLRVPGYRGKGRDHRSGSPDHAIGTGVA